MGVMIRSQGDLFVITSDRFTDDLPSKSAPKRNKNDTYRVWAGAKWSTNAFDARTFNTTEEADEYVRSNSSQIMESG
jgi:hypothetical protein